MRPLIFFKFWGKETLMLFTKTKFNSKVVLMFVQIGNSKVYSLENWSLQSRSRRTEFINMGPDQVFMNFAISETMDKE